MEQMFCVKVYYESLPPPRSGRLSVRIVIWGPEDEEPVALTNFTRAIDFKVLDRLVNLTPVWKCVKLPSVSCLNNLERLSIVICLNTNDFLLHRPLRDFTIFSQIYQNVNYFLVK